MSASSQPLPCPVQETGLNRGYVIGLIGVVLWSTTGILISYLLTNYPLLPLTLAFWRNVFATTALGLGLWVVCPAALRIGKRDYGFLLLYGVSLTLVNMSWTYSIGFNGAAVSTVLVYSSAGLTTVAARFLFAERLSLIRIAAVLACTAGCVLIAGAHDPEQWNVNPAGIVVGIVSAVSFTFYSIMGKLTFRRDIPSWSATFYAFAFSTVVLFFTQLQGPMLSLGTQADGWLILLVLAIVPTLGGFGLYTASLGYLPTGTANLLATLEPVLTTILACLLLRESLTAIQWLGVALSIASILAMRLEKDPVDSV